MEQKFQRFIFCKLNFKKNHAAGKQCLKAIPAMTHETKGLLKQNTLRLPHVTLDLSKRFYEYVAQKKR